jgi:hypothetical protein
MEQPSQGSPEVPRGGARGRLIRAAAVAFVIVAVLSGCATHAPGEPAAPPELLSSGPVVLPADCVPGDGVVYRTAFVVQRDGRVADIATQSGAGCVRQALQAWVATFRYRPLAEATPAVVDWMTVTAERGG